MGGQRFDTPQPEAYLFGENSDLNYLCSRPAHVSKTSKSLTLSDCVDFFVRIEVKQIPTVKLHVFTCLESKGKSIRPNACCSKCFGA